MLWEDGEVARPDRSREEDHSHEIARAKGKRLAFEAAPTIEEASHPIAALWTADEGGFARIIATEQAAVGARPIEDDPAQRGRAVGRRQRRDERAERLPSRAPNEARQRVLAPQHHMARIARPVHMIVDRQSNRATIRQPVRPNEDSLARAGVESAQPVVESMRIDRVEHDELMYWRARSCCCGGLPLHLEGDSQVPRVRRRRRSEIGGTRILCTRVVAGHGGAGRESDVIELRIDH